MATTNTKKAMSKSQLAATLAENTGLSKADINKVLAALSDVIHRELSPSGPQVFSLPGIVKFTVSHKPATSAREGVSPFTGEKIIIAAKPERNVVRARVLKPLKEAV
ncbi:MAG: DNA-binding protein HU-beta [Candidatus Roseilinea sp.]|nr:MAG: DNA-binding protein HU-beta [Candidatus Roseilinea sp.]